MRNLENTNKGEIIIYQTPDGIADLEVRLENENIWPTQAQMVMLFGRDLSVISKHIRNIFKEKELDKNSVYANFAYTATDNKTYNVEHYNLDAIISVGYRVKSQRGTQFRIWANRVLKDYIIKGYAINQHAKAGQLEELKKTVTILVTLVIVTFSSLYGQNKPLKIIEPKFGFTPVLNENELKKELQKIEKIHETYGNDYEKHLSKKQQEIYWNYLDREDFWDVGPIGCSWYCGGGPDSIYASSELKPQHGTTYNAKNAHDFSLRTAWIEGVPGYGIGESITYRFQKLSPPVTQVGIFNGYMKSDKTWQENSRVKQLKLYVNNKPYAILNLEDTKTEQLFSIANPPGLQGVNSDLYLKFEILDVYKGDKYDDTAISEIEFDGTGVHCFAKGTMIAILNGEKPVEKLNIGDTVLTLNTATNKIETAIIQQLASRKHHLYELDFGERKIEVTEDHPLYWEGSYYSIVKNNLYGVETNLLSVGQKINFLSNGEIKTVTLKGIKKLDRYENTFTITQMDRNKLFFANGICAATEPEVQTSSIKISQ